MLRTTFSTIALTTAILAAPAAHASFISTATIEGGALYSSTNNVSFGGIENRLGVTLDRTAPEFVQLRDQYGFTGYNLGLYASLTDFSINLPQVDAPVMWNLAIDFTFDADFQRVGSTDRETFSFTFSDDQDIAPVAFSINDAAGAFGANFTDLGDLETQFNALVSSIPLYTDIGVGAILASTTVLDDPSLLVFLQADPLQFLRDQAGINIPAIANGFATFNADITLTAVSEPGSLALLGMGLAGIGMASRSRRKTNA